MKERTQAGSVGIEPWTSAYQQAKVKSSTFSAAVPFPKDIAFKLPYQPLTKHKHRIIILLYNYENNVFPIITQYTLPMYSYDTGKGKSPQRV